MDKCKKLQKHYEAAIEIALLVLEERARKILHDHKNLHEFVIGMGTWYFTDHQDNMMDFEYVDEFIYQWNDILGLTGHPMRFTEKGPVITEW